MTKGQVGHLAELWEALQPLVGEVFEALRQPPGVDLSGVKALIAKIEGVKVSAPKGGRQGKRAAPSGLSGHERNQLLYGAILTVLRSNLTAGKRGITAKEIARQIIARGKLNPEAIGIAPERLHLSVAMTLAHAPAFAKVKGVRDKSHQATTYFYTLKDVKP